MMAGLGYSSKYYWEEMNPRDVIVALRGMRWYEDQTRWTYTLYIAKLIRWLGTLIHNLWAKKPKKPTHFLKFPDEESSGPPNEEEMKELRYLAKKWKNVK
jgi:hypothetical protein